MSDHASGNPYKIYWKTWAILLVITVAMLAAEAFHMPRLVLVLFLLAFMAVKAAMIGGNFMHLRFEKTNLAVMVAVGHRGDFPDPLQLPHPGVGQRAGQDREMSPRRAVSLLALFVLLGLAAEPAFAQCAMCRSVIAQSPEGQRVAGELNKAILLMFFAPYLIFGSFAAWIFRSRIGVAARRLAGLVLLPR